MTAQIRNEVRALKRERILEVAARLFFEKGYNGTSMENICAELGVTKPFIYYHFAKKDDMLLALYASSLTAALEVMETVEQATDDPTAQVRLFARDYTLLVLRDQMRIALHSREKGLLSAEQMQPINADKREFFQRILHMIRAGIEAGQFDVPDAGLATHSITGMINWTITWYLPDGRMSAEDIAASMETSILRVLGVRQSP